jgi:thiamine-phosphate pyrophosphorylase
VNKLLAARSQPLIYAITDRSLLTAANTAAAVNDFIVQLIGSGVDLIQIRERDLPARVVFELAKSAALSAKATGSLILVNDRSDIAASAGVGVHLTTRSMDARVVRRVLERGAPGAAMPIGASTHNLDEALKAEQAGADFIVFGPVFETRSKQGYGPPVGLAALERVCSRVTVPVLGLGGIDSSNFRQVLGSGADGVAGISVFTNRQMLGSLVRRIKGYSASA